MGMNTSNSFVSIDVLVPPKEYILRNVVNGLPVLKDDIPLKSVGNDADRSLNFRKKGFLRF